MNSLRKVQKSELIDNGTDSLNLQNTKDVKFFSISTYGRKAWTSSWWQISSLNFIYHGVKIYKTSATTKIRQALVIRYTLFSNFAFCDEILGRTCKEKKYKLSTVYPDFDPFWFIGDLFTDETLYFMKESYICCKLSQALPFVSLVPLMVSLKNLQSFWNSQHLPSFTVNCWNF